MPDEEPWRSFLVISCLKDGDQDVHKLVSIQLVVWYTQDLTTKAGHQPTRVYLLSIITACDKISPPPFITCVHWK